MKEVDVAVIGGGISGLCCAKIIAQGGRTCCLLEGSDDVGGCMRTDVVDGFLLDRGFQVYLTACEEPKRHLDLEALELGTFLKGALVRRHDGFIELLDPWRHFLAAPKMLFGGLGTLRDKFLLAKLRHRVISTENDEISNRPSTSTFYCLREMGFSEEMLEGFFRPFFGGVFLDPGLETSSQMLEYTFRMFAIGHAALPKGGIGAIPKQLREKLPEAIVRLQTKVRSIEDGKVNVERGEKVKAKAIVVATGAREAARLVPAVRPPEYRSVTCLYYAAKEAPIEKPVLILSAQGSGPVNHLCVPSTVQPSYAPVGSHLISVTVLGLSEEKELERQVRKQLFDWFGPVVRDRKHLRTSAVSEALPAQIGQAEERFSRFGDIYVVGDYFGNASIEGAMLSARGAAEALLDSLQ